MLNKFRKKVTNGSMSSISTNHQLTHTVYYYHKSYSSSLRHPEDMQLFLEKCKFKNDSCQYGYINVGGWVEIY